MTFCPAVVILILLFNTVLIINFKNPRLNESRGFLIQQFRSLTKEVVVNKEAGKIVFLQGKRIYLRPILREDIPNLLRWINDEEVTQYLKTFLPMMEADEERWFDDLSKKKQTDITLAIMVLDEGVMIGVMGIHGINWKDRTATTGALIGEKRYWGKGYGTEAKMLLLNYAFNTLNLRKINSSVLAFNDRSYAYQLKCGYIEEGRKREERYHNGRYWDEIFMAVFKSAWIPLWKEYKRKHFS